MTQTKELIYRVSSGCWWLITSELIAQPLFIVSPSFGSVLLLCFGNTLCSSALEGAAGPCRKAHRFPGKLKISCGESNRKGRHSKGRAAVNGIAEHVVLLADAKAESCKERDRSCPHLGPVLCGGGALDQPSACCGEQTT